MALRVSDLNFVTSPSGLIVPEVTDNPALGNGAADVAFDLVAGTTEGWVLTTVDGEPQWAPPSGAGGGGVDSIEADGGGQLTGDVTFSAGSGITMATVGNDVEIAASGGGFTFTTYTPTLTATVTNPTLGSGATSSGRYAQSGKLVFVTVLILFGSGMTAGSGTYQIALPVTAATAAVNQGVPLGFGWLVGTSRIHTLIDFVDNSKLQMRYLTAFASGFGTLVSNANPWTWANTYHMDLHFAYEAA